MVVGLVLLGLLGYMHAAQLPDCVLIVDSTRCPAILSRPVSVLPVDPWVQVRGLPQLSAPGLRAERLADGDPQWRD